MKISVSVWDGEKNLTAEHAESAEFKQAKKWNNGTME
jgi:hypothetical protein